MSGCRNQDGRFAKCRGQGREATRGAAGRRAEVPGIEQWTKFHFSHERRQHFGWLSQEGWRFDIYGTSEAPGASEGLWNLHVWPPVGTGRGWKEGPFLSRDAAVDVARRIPEQRAWAQERRQGVGVGHRAEGVYLGHVGGADRVKDTRGHDYKIDPEAVHDAGLRPGDRVEVCNVPGRFALFRRLPLHDPADPSYYSAPRGRAVSVAVGPGDRIRFIDYRGAVVSGKIVMRARGGSGWVVNIGGRYGTPMVVPDDAVLPQGGGRRTAWSPEREREDLRRLQAQGHLQQSFIPVDYHFEWTGTGPGGWYAWDYAAGHKAARAARDAAAKQIKAAGYTVRKWSLPNQLITRGGIGSGHPQIENVVTVYMLDADRAPGRRAAADDPWWRAWATARPAIKLLGVTPYGAKGYEIQAQGPEGAHAIWQSARASRTDAEWTLARYKADEHLLHRAYGVAVSKSGRGPADRSLGHRAAREPRSAQAQDMGRSAFKDGTVYRVVAFHNKGDWKPFRLKRDRRDFRTLTDARAHARKMAAQGKDMVGIILMRMRVGMMSHRELHETVSPSRSAR